MHNLFSTDYIITILHKNYITKCIKCNLYNSFKISYIDIVVCLYFDVK